MILVDTSVWIDYFRGVVTPQSDKLDTLLGVEQVFTGDLILTEVLQGFVSERDFNQARKLLASIPLVPLVGEDIALQAARNFGKTNTIRWGRAGRLRASPAPGLRRPLPMAE